MDRSANGGDYRKLRNELPPTVAGVSDGEARWRALVSGAERSWWSPLALAGLGALGVLYRGVVTAYRGMYDVGMLRTRRLPCRVISVGNITLGGTGKTTTVRWLTHRLRNWGLRPAILSYGYRAGTTREERNRVVVVAGPEGIRAPASATGDEAQLLARSLPGVPVLIGRRRVVSGQQACEEFHPDVCVLDDAFQYWRLGRDVDLVLVDGTNPFGYGRTFPRGMLREGLGALRRADAVIVTHAAWQDDAGRAHLRRRLLELNPALVLAEARHVPVRMRDAVTGAEVPLSEMRDGTWLAVSSLGSPESFERTLSDLGVPGTAARFPDHHPYTRADLEALRQRAAGLAGIVTTEKDAVKIPLEWLGDTPYRVLEIDLEFLSGQDVIEALLRSRLQ